MNEYDIFIAGIIVALNKGWSLMDLMIEHDDLFQEAFEDWKSKS